MKNIIQNQFLQAYSEQGTSQITLKWFPESSKMTEDNLKEFALTAGNFVAENGIQKWLGDTREFNFAITPELQDWHSNELNKILIGSKLAKMALLVPSELIAELGLQQTVDEIHEAENAPSFHTRYFDDISEAQQWLDS